jgi:hypothetical protein
MRIHPFAGERAAHLHEAVAAALRYELPLFVTIKPGAGHLPSRTHSNGAGNSMTVSPDRLTTTR